MKKTVVLIVLNLSLILSSPSIADITATPGDDAQVLVGQLLSVSSGATTSNETVTPGVCSGLFSGGTSGSTPVGGDWLIDSGVMLSSGAVSGISAPNSSDSLTVQLGLPGDAFLDALVNGNTQDACVLEFDFQCPEGSAGSEVAFRYNFASEEYNEFVGSVFNDVFGFQLNGSNIAVIPGSTTPVAISNVNAIQNVGFYNNNDPDDTLTPYAIEADGFTDTFTATGSANLPINHIKLAIADRGDALYDSWVGIEGGSFECIAQVSADVKPGSNPNCVKPKPKGVVSVAFYSSAEVDACNIDQTSLDYLGAGAARCDCTDAPVVDPFTLVETYDGINDLVCKFAKADMNLPQPGDDCVSVNISGTFTGGGNFEAQDHMCVAGDAACEAGTIQ